MLNVLLARRFKPHRAGRYAAQPNHTGLWAARVMPVLMLIVAVFAFFMGSGLSGAWEQVLLYLNQTAFNIFEPIFNHDAGFYIFTLPVWQIAA